MTRLFFETIKLLIYCFLLITFNSTDSNCEKPGEIYVPRDENFGHLKTSDFLVYGIKSISQFVLPTFESIFDLNLTPNEFESFEDVRNLFEGGIKLPTDIISSFSPLPAVKELFRTDGEEFLKFPKPQVIQGVINKYKELHTHIYLKS